MPNRLAALLCFVAFAFSACSDDETSPAGPQDPANTYYVNTDTGDDSGAGSSGAPWATITHAIATAPEDFTIRVAPGTYDAANGETFPIVLKPGQKLIGDVANQGLGVIATRIQGEAVFPHSLLDGAVIVGAQGARVAGFAIVTVTDPNFYSGVVAVGIVMEIDHNTFEDTLYNGVGAVGGAAPDIHDNLFQSRTYGLFLDTVGAAQIHDNVINSRTGMRGTPTTGAVIEDNAITSVGISIDITGTATIRNNQFLQTAAYTIGAIRTSGGSPVIRGNSFASGGPALAVRQSGTPDAGTGASPGQNDFSDIVGVVVHHEGTESVMAVGNAWPNTPPLLGVDIVITGTGSVTWSP